MGPVTTNPWLIAIINMAIVFAVLIALGVLMSLIQVIDPTKKKAATPAAPAAAPKAPAAAPKAAAAGGDALVAVITAAIAAAQGCSSDQVRVFNITKANAWSANAAVDAINARKDSFYNVVY